MRNLFFLIPFLKHNVPLQNNSIIYSDAIL